MRQKNNKPTRKVWTGAVGGAAAAVAFVGIIEWIAKTFYGIIIPGDVQKDIVTMLLFGVPIAAGLGSLVVGYFVPPHADDGIE